MELVIVAGIAALGGIGMLGLAVLAEKTNGL